jgi:hypothetical protein
VREKEKEIAIGRKKRGKTSEFERKKKQIQNHDLSLGKNNHKQT